MKKTINLNLDPNWKQYLTLAWCSLFHRKHHVHFPKLRTIFCKKCDPACEKRIKKAAFMNRIGIGRKAAKRLREL